MKSVLIYIINLKPFYVFSNDEEEEEEEARAGGEHRMDKTSTRRMAS